MTQNIVVQAFKTLIIDLIGEVLYFPIWWYSAGLFKIILFFIRSVKNTNRDLALGLLLRNFFKPMFGVQDRTGRLISLFMRFILVLGRLILFLLLVIFYLLVVLFWVVLPVIVAAGLYYNFRIFYGQYKV
ncbi:MAG: hypothetical protein C3F02_04070 [Parcubacteria group bacterium]|nr:MAG: hypothetical protein C3F02_04070 [Parcubacteria group bacterium]